MPTTLAALCWARTCLTGCGAVGKVSSEGGVVLSFPVLPLPTSGVDTRCGLSRSWATDLRRRYHAARDTPAASHGRSRESELARYWARGIAPFARRLRPSRSRLRAFLRLRRSALGRSTAPMVVMQNQASGQPLDRRCTAIRSPLAKISMGAPGEAHLDLGALVQVIRSPFRMGPERVGPGSSPREDGGYRPDETVGGDLADGRVLALDPVWRAPGAVGRVLSLILPRVPAGRMGRSGGGPVVVLDALCSMCC